MGIAPVCTKAVHLDNKISNSTVQPKKNNTCQKFFFVQTSRSPAWCWRYFYTEEFSGGPVLSGYFKSSLAGRGGGGGGGGGQTKRHFPVK